MHLYSIESEERKKVSLYIALAGVVVSLAFHKYLPPLLTKLFPNMGLEVPWLVSVPSALVIYGILYWLFDEHLWKFAHSLRITQVPNLNGKWDACIKSSRDNFKERFCIQMTIHQTWSRISLIVENEELISYSLMASFKSFNPERRMLRYEYFAEPKPLKRANVLAHNGTCHITINLSKGEIVEPLTAEYYNNHGNASYGEMLLTRKRNETGA